MGRPDATAIKTAITGGATFSGGMIVQGGVAKYCLLTVDEAHPDGAWTLDAGSGVRVFNQTHFERMRDYPLITDPEDDNFRCFDIPENKGGPRQLLQMNFGGPDVAALSDP